MSFKRNRRYPGIDVIKSLAEIMEEMFRHYRRSPSGWRMLSSRDEWGHHDFFFCNPKVGLWQVKGEFRTPYEFVGAGAKVIAGRVDDRIRELMRQGSPMPFGMFSPHPKRMDSVIIAAGIGQYLEAHPRMEEFLSEKQRMLDSELRAKLEKLCRDLGMDLAYG